MYQIQIILKHLLSAATYTPFSFSSKASLATPGKAPFQVTQYA
jgi:hypothetical protein